MKFKVYHAINPTFGFGDRPKYPSDYKQVAIVEAEDIEEVFRITNHIDDNWENNPEVLEVIGNGHRSTSVGDIVVDENGVVNRCEIVGWVKVPPSIVEVYS